MPRIVRNLYNPPAHLVRQLDDWLAGEALRDPAGALAQCLALDAAYEDAAALDASRLASQPVLDASRPASVNGVWHCQVCGAANLDEEPVCHDCMADEADAADEASLAHFDRYVAGDRK